VGKTFTTRTRRIRVKRRRSESTRPRVLPGQWRPRVSTGCCGHLCWLPSHRRRMNPTTNVPTGVDAENPTDSKPAPQMHTARHQPPSKAQRRTADAPHSYAPPIHQASGHTPWDPQSPQNGNAQIPLSLLHNAPTQSADGLYVRCTQRHDTRPTTPRAQQVPGTTSPHRQRTL
jgi:hypothetical protein